MTRGVWYRLLYTNGLNYCAKINVTGLLILNVLFRIFFLLIGSLLLEDTLSIDRVFGSFISLKLYTKGC